MAKTKKPAPESSSKALKSTSADSDRLREPKNYFNRELSWLEFNYRVLYEALDDRTPLLERLKFMAIVSMNLDEFFMVRVAGLKQQVKAEVRKLTPDGRSPQQQLNDISDRLHPIFAEQHQHFQTILRPQLAAHGIYLLDYIDLNAKVVLAEPDATLRRGVAAGTWPEDLAALRMYDLPTNLLRGQNFPRPHPPRRRPRPPLPLHLQPQPQPSRRGQRSRN